MVMRAASFRSPVRRANARQNAACLAAERYERTGTKAFRQFRRPPGGMSSGGGGYVFATPTEAGCHITQVSTDFRMPRAQPTRAPTTAKAGVTVIGLCMRLDMGLRVRGWRSAVALWLEQRSLDAYKH
jgi:hypothetical protein